MATSSDPVLRRLLDPAHHRLDLGTEPDRVGADLEVGRVRRGDAPQQLPAPQASA